jgi:ubiquinone/menaquinone biosynthesis C-methylase UbiE
MSKKADSSWDINSTSSIADRYDDVAHFYDFIFMLPELLLMTSRSRQKFISRVRGRVLEIAVGTGRNIRYYNRPVDLTLADISPLMLKRARHKASLKNLPANYVLLDGERLPFPDHTFDSVLTSLCITSFPNPVKALREMARVCRPDGRILLLENGRSSNRLLSAYQDRVAEEHVKKLGTRWNRDPVQICAEAGLPIRHLERRFLGILHLMELAPDLPASETEVVSAAHSPRQMLPA